MTAETTTAAPVPGRSHTAARVSLGATVILVEGGTVAEILDYSQPELLAAFGLAPTLRTNLAPTDSFRATPPSDARRSMVGGTTRRTA